MNNPFNNSGKKKRRRRISVRREAERRFNPLLIGDDDNIEELLKNSHKR